MLLHPEWDRPCADCQRWIYRDDEQTPLAERGEVMRFGGKLVPRDLKLVPTPCHRCEKVPLPLREQASEPGVLSARDAIEPEDRHRRAVDFHMECRAVLAFPDDSLVRRSAALIQPIVEQRQRRPLELLISIVAALARRR